MSETIAFLGCSRGLGKEVVLAFDESYDLKDSWLVARKEPLLKELTQKIRSDVFVSSVDFSNPQSAQEILEALASKPVQKIFYFAGGGPYGQFQDKDWKDHTWSFQVNFLTPAFLIHQILKNPIYKGIEQIIMIGSQVADQTGDKNASSYAAGKHALRGLIESIHLETPQVDLRLFRPHYMDTELLPKNAAVRGSGAFIQSPSHLAKIFVSWSLDPQAEKILTI